MNDTSVDGWCERGTEVELPAGEAVPLESCEDHRPFLCELNQDPGVDGAREGGPDPGCDADWDGCSSGEWMQPARSSAVSASMAAARERMRARNSSSDPTSRASLFIPARRCYPPKYRKP